MRYIGKIIVCLLSVYLLFGITRLVAETPPKDYHFQTALKQYLEGDKEAALVSLKKSLEINPDSRETRELVNQITGKKKIEPVIVAERKPALPSRSLEPGKAAQQVVLAKKETPEPALPSESLNPAAPIGSFVYAPPQKIIRQYPNHLEADFSFEYLDPNGTYGSWKNFGLAFYRKQSESLTYFLTGGIYWRDEGSGINGGAGIYKTWNKYLFTSSSVSAGTDVSYLPELSLSHTFNFKLGQKQNNVVPLGFTYIKSRSGHEDYIISSGITAYRAAWVYGYQISRNQNEPGSVISYSHLLSVAHGQEGSQWLTFTLSSGQEAYLATYLTTPEEVNQDSYGAAIRLKRWLGKNYGFLGEISYFKLGSSYDKYGLSFGMFTDF